MCGIIGGIDPASSPASRSEKIRLRDLMAHRGPDDAGLWESDDRTVWLGHRRLTIIDLTRAGHQPMGTRDGRQWLTFNGEVYNYKLLRSELVSEDAEFVGTSDTTVLLAALSRWGIEAVSRLRGMYAFGWFDGSTRTLWLVRDRIGIKPLYYWLAEDGKRFRFASELKSLAEDEAVDPVLDPQSIDDFLAFQYIPAPYTAYKGVRKVRPGHLLRIKIGEDGKVDVEERRYWHLPVRQDATITEADALERLQSLISESVELRLASDVPLGVFLSGGVDSSLVAATAAQSGPVSTFSIGFEEASYSEADQARCVAKHIGSDHHEEIVAPDATELLPRLVGQYDEPFGDSSAIPTFLVSQYARNDVKVCLSGDGGDELFAGYIGYGLLEKSTRYDWVPSGLWSMAARLVPEHNRLHKRLSLMQFDVARRSVELASMFPSWERGHLYAQGFERFFDDCSEACRPPPGDRYRPTFGELPDPASPIDRVTYQDLHYYLVDDILTKVDRASMLASLEVRVPLLDHVLVEYAFSLPTTLRTRTSTPKYLLKKIARKLVPSSVVDRPKMGFGIPIELWFRNELSTFVERELFDGHVASDRILDRGSRRRVVERHQRGGRNFSQQIWQMLVLEFWCRQHERALRNLPG